MSKQRAGIQRAIRANFRQVERKEWLILRSEAASPAAPSPQATLTIF